jgi:hypothetical protein
MPERKYFKDTLVRLNETQGMMYAPIKPNLMKAFYCKIFTLLQTNLLTVFDYVYALHCDAINAYKDLKIESKVS